MDPNNFNNMNSWMMMDTNKKLKDLRDIEEEKLMLEKAKALGDMSISEEYVKRKAKEKETNTIVGTILGVIFLVAFLGFMAYLFMNQQV